MGIPLAFVFLAALGFPFKWAKTRGGLPCRVVGHGNRLRQLPTGTVGEEGKLAGKLATRDMRSVSGRSMAQGLGRPGFAALALEWEKHGEAVSRPSLLLVVSHTMQGKIGEMKIIVVIRVLCLWLAERLEGNDRLQAPSKLSTETIDPRFFTDANS